MFSHILVILAIAVASAAATAPNLQKCSDSNCHVNCTSITIPDGFCNPQNNQKVSCLKNGIYLGGMIYQNASCTGAETHLALMSGQCQGDASKMANNFAFFTFFPGTTSLAVKLACDPTCTSCAVSTTVEIETCASIIPGGLSINIEKLTFDNFVALTTYASPECQGMVSQNSVFASGHCLADNDGGSLLFSC